MAKKKDEKIVQQVQEQQVEEAPQAPAVEEPPKVDFDAWWATVQTKLAAHHHKEIVKADFRGRGLTSMETMKDYHNALAQYGVKLR